MKAKRKKMQYKLTIPSKLKKEIVLPASKSISNRALVINALASTRIMPSNVSDCDDTEVMARALTEKPEIVDIMAAGTAMRFLTAYYSVTEGDRIITGTERMKHRPIKILVDALRFLGADIVYVGEEGFPPLRIRGKQLVGGNISLAGNISSQYISALLMVGPVLASGLTLHLTGTIISRPYIDMTLQLMRDFGAKALWEDEKTIAVEPVPYLERSYTVENDWSGASYWYELVALSPDEDAMIVLPGLFMDSYQGDSSVWGFFEELGVATVFQQNKVILRKKELNLEPVHWDLSSQPDLAQTLVVTCALLGKPFHFTGLQTLKIKETDRIKALRRELLRLGFVISEANDSELYWNGPMVSGDEIPVIRTYEDHRMAMAFAPAVYRFPEIRIADPHVVSKSYPHFWKALRDVGFTINEEDICTY